MDVRDLSRIDLGLLAAAVGPHRKLFVSMILAAIIKEHGLDVQIVREGRGYTIVGTETMGHAVVGEYRLAIVWEGIDEVVRLPVLRLYVEGVLAGHEEWRRRTNKRLARLGVSPIPPGIAADDG